MSDNMLIKPEAHNPDIHRHDHVHPELLSAFTHVMEYIGKDNDLTPADKSNFADTAVRAAKAFQQLVRSKSDIDAEIRHILRTGFPLEPSEKDQIGMITQGPIHVYSMCPHHLLPVDYLAYVSYLPSNVILEHADMGGVVLGLSKLARITKVLARRPVLQEQLATDIASVLHFMQGQTVPGIETQGSAVALIGKHMCMACRGVESEAATVTVKIRGEYFRPEMEHKFYKAIELANLKGTS